MPVAIKLHASMVVRPPSVPCHLRPSPTARRTDRGLSVKSVLVSGPSSQVSSSPLPRKRVTFADDTPVSACVSEYRSTQRPRRTNPSVVGGVRPDYINKKTTAWHSSILSCKSHIFCLFVSSRSVQIFRLCRRLSSARNHC